MPNTRSWTIFLCCLLSIQDLVGEVTGQQKYGVPLTGNGSAIASKCNAVKQSWVQASGSLFVSVSTFNSTRTFDARSTVYTTLTYLSGNATSATPYTLCDGYPRINGSRTLTSTFVPYTVTSTTLTTTSVFTKLPAPNCTINSKDCAQLEKAYESAKSLETSYYNSPSPNANDAPPIPISPICGPATLVSVSSAVENGVCAMNEASVQLLYWPVTVPSSCDSCHRSNCPTTTTAPSTSGRANTAIWRNITLTSPTVYIAFEGSWSFTSDGKDYTEPAQLVIPQTADAVSSYCGKLGGGYGPPQKVNYADFNSPVPADVYRCQPSCYRDPLPYSAVDSTVTRTYTMSNQTMTETFTPTSYLSIAPTNLCSTIWDDYAPVLSIPEAFKTIKPAGHVDVFGQANVCQFIFDENAVLFDPPIALTEVQSEVKPTLPAYNTAQPTAADTYTALPVETGQAGHPTGHNPARPGEHTPPQVRPTPPPGGGRVEQTATALNVGGYVASGIGLTVPNSAGGQYNGGSNGGLQNEGWQNGGGPNNGGQNGGGHNEGWQNGGGQTVGGQNNGGQNDGGQNGGGQTVGGQNGGGQNGGGQTVGGQNGGGQNGGGQNGGGQNGGGQNGGGQIGGGVTIAVAPGGNGLVINGATTTLVAYASGVTGFDRSSGAASGGSGESGGPHAGYAEVGLVTIGGQPRPYAKQGSQVIIDGQAIARGGTAVIAGQTVSLSSDGTHIEVDTGSGKTTMDLKPAGTTLFGSGQAGYITAAGTTLTYSAADGTTMIDGNILESDSTTTLTSARSSASKTESRSQTTSTGSRPASNTSSAAATSMRNKLDWRYQLPFWLGLAVFLAEL
ncbi:hypothetical protein DOTSEDRAFT_24588 [Dothistroma septosporum NZE10]|uniref:Uncharacterized protein n=1 Tax=Dothistroma septosporum (strain NZE10 / CBS 128990) TaxID=675120 RepID=N1PNR9_DOTSN|nr:hypothetical protein DOTSEDRAFT_24588 [Dothistroma septosporum NZE10]